MALDHVSDDVSKAINTAGTVGDACQGTLDAMARQSDINGAVLLQVHDHLRTVAATGSWHIYSTVHPGAGVVGRVYSSGEPSVVSRGTHDPDYIALSPSVVLEICVPIASGPGRPIGVLNLEWSTSADIDEWLPTAGHAARLLGRRIRELGGPPAESRSEKLLRHGFALTTAASETELLAHSLYAARDVSGLDSPILVINLPGGGIEVDIDRTHPTELAARVADIAPERWRDFITRALLYGASSTIGDPATLSAEGFETLTSVGVRTLISIPVGVSRDRSTIGGVLLVASERVSRPEAETLNLLALLAAQAWSSHDRLRTLQDLRQMAVCDPLTGLPHHGSFSERLDHATANRTAVFAIDIDSFKTINDTYGHQAGDRALVELSRALSSSLRAGDDLYRIGGDEFAVVVDAQGADEALSVAERLVAAARCIGRTISVGVAIHHEGETPSETLSRADAALYVAKRTGRDGVRVAA